MFCRETAELLVTVHFFVPFLPVILIFVYFCLKVDEESDLLFFLVQTSVKFSELGSFNTTKYVRSTVPSSYLAIGADTVLKLGAQTPAQSAGNFF